MVGLFAVFLATEACAQTTKRNYSIRDGELYRRTRPNDLRAIVDKDLVAAPFNFDTFIYTIHDYAKMGINTIVFDLQGYNEDGTALDEEALENLYTAIYHMNWRYYSPVINILPDGTPDDAEWRKRAVETAADEFRRKRDVLYWIDGENAAELVELFKGTARGATVIAPEGGDVTLTETLPEETPSAPVMVVGAVHDSPKEGIHYLLPAREDSLDRWETVSRLPAEREPWEPDNSVLSKEEREEGFIALFNGRNFDGWTITGDPAGWTIENGEIRFARRGGGVIAFRNRYDDFILRLEFKISEGGNSGVFLRAPRACRSSKIGMESQIMGDFGREPTDTSTGAIYDVLAPRANWSKPAGEWNQLEIMVEGDRYQSVLNGEIAIQVNLGDHPELKYRLKEGFIGLQDHSDPVAFRKIRLKEL